MNIKKLSNHEIIIENDNSEVIVDFSTKDALKIRFKKDSFETEISKPGEYGYLEALIEAYESTLETPKAKIDFVLVDTAGVRIVFVFGEGNLTKEDLAKLANIQIVVFNLEDNAKAKNFENELEAKIMMFVKNSDEESDKFKKELGFAEVTTNSKYSYSSKDFESEVEVPVSYVVLGK